MVDFRLNKEQLTIRDAVREFVTKELKPLAQEYDAKTDPKDCFPIELVKTASTLDLRTLNVPEEYGGVECDQITLAVILEELGAGDLGFASLIGQHTKYIDYLSKLCNEEQKAEWMPKLVKDDTFLIASAITEPDAGTDSQLPYEEPGAGMSTFAERREDEYIINGTKHFISNGGAAKLYFVFARTKENAPFSQSVSIFIVPPDAPGFSVARIHDKLGRRLMLNAELVFSDARIPAGNLVGEENKAWQMFYGQSPGINNTISCLVGGIRTCYEESLDFAKKRIQGGVPIIKHTPIGTMLAEMRVKVEASRALLWRNASSWDHKYEYDPKMNYLTKAFVNRMALEIVNDTMEIFGGMGTMKDMPVEKYLRDIYTILHAYGNPSINMIKGMPTV